MQRSSAALLVAGDFGATCAVGASSHRSNGPATPVSLGGCGRLLLPHGRSDDAIVARSIPSRHSACQRHASAQTYASTSIDIWRRQLRELEPRTELMQNWLGAYGKDEPEIPNSESA